MTSSPTLRRRLRRTDGASQQSSEEPLSLHPHDAPISYQSWMVLRSAVGFVSRLSEKFDWVGIYVLKGQTLELGPYVGDPTEHTRIDVGKGICGTSELVVLVRNRHGSILGQIDIDSHTPAAFGPEEEDAVKNVAKELGELWDDLESR